MKKKILAALLAAAMMFTVAGCSNGDSGKDTSVQDIKDKGELVVLTNAAFPPFEYMDGDEIKGVDIDIAQAIADELGVKLTVTNMDFDPIVDYVKSGRGDLGIAGMTINDERKQAIDFSDEYITTTQYIIVPKDTDESTFDPNGKVIGVQQGTTGDFVYASDVLDAKEVKRYKSGVDAVADLKAGRVDCVIIDELPAKKLAEQNADAVKAYDPGYDKESYAIAMKKGSTELQTLVNKVLKDFADSGKLEESIVAHTSNA